MLRAALLLGVVVLAGCDGFETHDHEYDFPTASPYVAPPPTNTSRTPTTNPTPIYKYDPYARQTGVNTYLQIVAGDHYSCGITYGSRVVCWGDVLDGMPPLLTAIGGDAKTACGARPSGDITCWGAAGGFDAPTTPRLTQVGVGDGFACALGSDFHAHCWGPSALQSPTDWTFEHLAVGSDHACGLDDKGVAHCWGNGDVATPDTGYYFAIAAGKETTCAIRTGTRAVDCWGRLKGRLGNFTSVAVGHGRACAIRAADGQAECWTTPDVDPDPDDNYDDVGWLKPPAVAFSSISIGATHACGIRRDNALALCWGSNVSGESSPM